MHVAATCSFDDLRKAYRLLAKQCHPDLFDNDPRKTEQFQILVHAFDILSDPESRAEYDRRMLFTESPQPTGHFRTRSIMDTVADDILEEMVVGNDVPPNATLKTLMLDLAHTERFIMFRQAKTFFFQGHFKPCYKLCGKLVSLSPDNILYHYYLAESARLLGKHSRASRHYRICLQIGICRNPPQRLLKIRCHYRDMQQKKGWLGKIIAWFIGSEPEPEITEEDKMRIILEESFNRVFKRQLKTARNSGAQRRLSQKNES